MLNLSDLQFSDSAPELSARSPDWAGGPKLPFKSDRTIDASRSVTGRIGRARPAARSRALGDTIITDFSVPELGLIATRQSRKDGGPICPLDAGRQTKPVGFYYSVKCGRFMAYRSLDELHAFYNAEVDTEVVSYRLRPHTLEFDLYGRPCEYTPSREETLSDGGARIRDVKEALDPAHDSSHTAKLERARLLYRSHGIPFDVEDRDHIEALPSFKIIEHIQAYRRTSATAGDLQCVRETFGDRRSVPFIEVRDRFASAPHGFAKISAMIVRRLVGINLSDGLSHMTPIFRVRL